MSKIEETPKCQFLGCDQPQKKNLLDNYQQFCEYHEAGGIFGSGEAYEQYQIIERDFINFIQIIPLTKDQYKVYSPMLRDIIIRTCVQIEIFFKEWAKQHICQDKNSSFFKKEFVDKQKSIRWTMKDYFYFKNSFDKSSIHVMPLNEDILPFQSWTDEGPPVWWKVYNGIKHDGHLKNKESTLENALYALAGLFLILCKNEFSYFYLSSFNSIVVKNSFDKIFVEHPDIATPIDSKKYLFKANIKDRPRMRPVVLLTEDQVNKLVEYKVGNKKRI